MRLLGLSVRDFRNLEEVDFAPGVQATLVVGANGQGKTNLLEAIYLLATLRPLRAQRYGELVRFGGPRARVSGRMSLQGIERTIGVEVSESGREAFLDGKPVRALGDYLGGVAVVAFTPDDLEIVKGSPDARRRLLDRAAFNRFPRHLDASRDYQRALRQRNRLLKEGAPDALVEVYTETLARTGAEVMARRQATLYELAPRVRDAFESIAPGDGGLAVGLASAILSPDERGEPLPTSELARRLDEALRRKLVRDRDRGFTSVGPHADDLDLAIGGRPARLYASQGQQRAIVLALRIGEIENLRAQSGEPPLLLLDDVSSELDPVRNGYLMGYLRASNLQVVLTTTDPRLVADAAQPDARRWTVRQGRVQLVENV